MRLILTRHGQTEWNTQHRMQGSGDSPLTERGLADAALLAGRLQPMHFDRIYSSPQPRAMRTAEILRGERGVAIIPDPNLAEVALGSWEGMTFAQARAADPERFELFAHKPALFTAEEGGEDFYDVDRRVKAFMDMVSGELGGSDACVLAVSHTVTLISARRYVSGDGMEAQRRYEAHSTSYSAFVYEDGAWRVEAYDDVGHLGDTNDPGHPR